MDLSISSSRSSSNDMSFSHVQSPMPIRNPVVLQKNRLASSYNFYEFLEDFGQAPNSRSLAEGLSLQRFRGYNSEGSVHEHKSIGGGQTEAERSRLVLKRPASRSHIVDVRPPSRARNPQVYDKEFLKMNISMRLQGASVEFNMETRDIEVIEHA